MQLALLYLFMVTSMNFLSVDTSVSMLGYLIAHFTHPVLQVSAMGLLSQAPLMPQRDWQVVGWREDDKNVQPEPSSGLGKITEQKGILGPGPAELRFPEAL
ncbi:UNVERIFIED_CONTAM: cap guanine-N7 methyltransferase 2 [Sesamum angustifolium]|uniref:Cap guanine-N7 methyltransferase 2 n=1 Tax=Sesamum angustifolium TaxID=2727405 RepID=A0AAW2LDQ7_9LAMI